MTTILRLSTPEKMWTFNSYSKEKGTTAYNLKSQIPEKIKQARVNLLIDAQSAVIDKINSRMTNKKVRILMDNAKYGRTFAEAPDIDGTFLVDSKKALKPGSFIQAKIIAAAGYNRKAKA